MSVADNVEDILTDIGFGRWQWLVLFTAFLIQTVGPMQQLGSTLLNAPVPFRCSFPNYNNLLNGTYYGIPNEDEIQYPSICSPEVKLVDIPVTQQSNESVIVFSKRVTGLPSCPEIEYDTSVFQSTVTTEWNLVCEASSLRALYQMAFALGGLIGSVICGQLSDWLGRKRTLQIGSLIATLSVTGTGVVPWYTVMIALKILCGLGFINTLFPAFTLLSEVSPERSRVIASIASGMSYFVSMVAFAAVGYLQPHWRKLTLICSSPLLLLVPLIFIIDESPRWLIQKGKTSEAVNILRKAARRNGISLESSTSKLPDKLEKIIQDQNADETNQDGFEKRDNFRSVGDRDKFELLRTCYTSPGMRTILILSPLMWFFQRALYIGIAINAYNFASSNTFEYVAFSGAMGILATALSIPASLKLTRRVFLAGALSTSGILMMLEMTVPPDYWIIKWIMVLTAFCLSSGAFQVNYIYAVELYPTLIRTRGFTLNSFVGAIGEVIIPLVTEIAVKYYWWAANVTFGLVGVIASFLLLFLPETKNLAIPETLQDVEDRYWRGRKKGCHNENPGDGITQNPRTLQI